MKTIVVIPTYNEAENLPLLLEEIHAVAPEMSVLIVDDNSPDGTGRLAEKLRTTRPWLHAIHREGKLGIGSAHLAGLTYAKDQGFDFAITMDCDFTHRPIFLPELHKKIEQSRTAMVIGSRYLRADGIRDWPLARRIITRTAHFMTTFLLGLPYDATNALRIYKLSELPFDRLRQIKTSGYAYMFEFVFICHYAGLRIDQIPVDLPVRHFGESKISSKEIFSAIRRLLELTFERMRLK